MRAWVLLLSGEASRAQGDLDDARTQYDLGRRADPATATGWLAGLRHAQVNFEMREFAQAARDLSGLVATAPSAEARALVLLLQAEAGYHAGQYAAAGAAFRRALVEFPSHPQAGAARLGVAWTALRQDRDDEARREFLEFVRLRPQDPQAPDALLLASELALKVPAEWNQAKVLLDRIIRDYPSRPRTEFAKFNRALLLLRAGDAKAQPELGDWIGRAPFPPLLGRAQAALGAALLAAGLPSDAEKAFAQAQREGLGALASLGLAAAQFAQGKLDVAKGLFEDARDKGTPTIAHAAEYGLAAIAFQGGAHKDFKQTALAALGAAPKGRGAPRLPTSWRGSPSRRRIGLAPWSFPSGSPTSSPPTRRRTTSSRASGPAPCPSGRGRSCTRRTASSVGGTRRARSPRPRASRSPTRRWRRAAPAWRGRSSRSSWRRRPRTRS